MQKLGKFTRKLWHKYWYFSFLGLNYVNFFPDKRICKDSFQLLLSPILILLMT